MNRIHRRVWSTALQCWVVVSELTRMRGKRAQTVCRSAAVAALLTTLPLAAGAAETTEEELDWWQWQTLSAFQSNGMLPSSVGTKAVHRLDVYNNTTASAWSLITAAETMAVGAEAHAGGVESIAVGIRSKSSGPNSVAVGNRAETYGSHAVAVGFGSRANSVGTVSIGNAARSDGHNAMAIGSGATSAGSGAIALGGDTRARAEGSIVLGDFAEVANNSSRHSIAIGNRASAGGYADSIALGRSARAHGTGKAMALGAEAKADHANSVALGADSATTAGNQVSVGNASLKRKIVNVGDGTLSSTSTDAVNGRQLHTVSQNAATALSTANTALANSRLVTQTSASSTIRIGADNTGTVLDVANRSGTRRRVQNIANGVLSTASTDAVTGQQLHATNTNVTAASTTATNALTTATAARTAADGALAKATVATNTTATGTAMTSTNKATATGTGALASGTSAKAQGTHAIALGLSAQATGNQTTALGRESLANATYATALGNLSKATAGRAVALGDRASASHENSVALGAGSVTASDNSVSVGTASSKRRIQYLADGSISATSTDAVTGSQLYSTNLGVAAAKDVADAASLAAGTAKSLVEAIAGQLGSTRIALGGSALADGDFATAVGHISVASGERALAMGVRSQASGKHANALGSGAQASGDEATALGRDTRASATSATAVGNLAVASHANAVALGAGSGTASANSVSVGSASNKRRIQHVDDGNLAANSTDAVTGGQLHATNSNVAKAQGAAGEAHTAANVAQTTADGAVARATALEGLVSQTSANGNLRLGVANTGTTLDVRNKDNRNRTLTGLASAVLDGNSTEAVAGKQLYATNQLVDSQGQVLAMHGQQLSGHAQQLVAQDGRIARNRTDLDKLREDVDNFDPDLDGVVKFNGDRSLVDMNGARVVGVAAGDISSAASSEAVNGGQLYATNQRVAEVESKAALVASNVPAGLGHAQAGLFGLAIGAEAEASLESEGATAIGHFALAQAKNSVALGRAAFVDRTATNGFALGTGANVLDEDGTAIGAMSQIEAGAKRSVALGFGSVATQADTVSVGNSTLQRRITQVARGRDESDVTTVSQLSDSLAALGGGARVDANGNVIAPTYTMQGGTQNTVGDALTALDGAVVTASTRVDRVESQLRATFQDAPSLRSDGLNQLNLAGANGMVLGNVANGLVAAGSRDAVNGGQLHALQQRLDGRIDGVEQRLDGTPQGRAMASADAPPVPQAEEAPQASGTPDIASAKGDKGGNLASADNEGAAPKGDAPASPPSPPVDTRQLDEMLARANEYTDGAIKGVEQRLDKMDKRFNRMAAMSSAQTAMAMNTAGLATYNRLGAGVGYSDGESAMAVGYQRVLNERGSATFSLNGAFTNSGEQSVGLGVGIGW